MSNAFANSTTFDQQDLVTREFRTLVGLHANQNSISKKEAVTLVSRETGLSVGTLENISRERIKHVRLNVRDSIRTALLRKLNEIISQTTHELYSAKLISPRMDCVEVTRAETRLAQTIEQAKEILAR